VRILKKHIKKHPNINLLQLNVAVDSEQQFEHRQYQGLLLQHQLQQVYRVHFHENDQLPALNTRG
jgi:hypothetical protein